MFVILIPWLGILVYLIARGTGMQERQLEQVRDAQRAQTEYIQSVAASTSTGAADQIVSAKGLLDKNGRQHAYPPMSELNDPDGNPEHQVNPYWRYIRDNIRAGVTQ